MSRVGQGEFLGHGANKWTSRNSLNKIFNKGELNLILLFFQTLVRNALTIEMANEAKKQGLKNIGITSLGTV